MNRIERDPDADPGLHAILMVGCAVALFWVAIYMWDDIVKWCLKFM